MEAKVKVLVVEDEWITSEEIKEVMLQNGFDVIGQAVDANTVHQIIEKDTPDVILMDINIKGNVDGIELATQIREKLNCAIIFLTAYDDDYFLRRAQKVAPASYLVKPFQAKNLTVAVKMAIQNISKDSENSEDDKETSFFVDDRIFIRENNRFTKMRVEDLYYAEAVGSYCEVHTKDQKYVLSMNLKSFEQKLDHPQFLRIHRSFLVNTRKVDAIEGNTVQVGGRKIPVSESNRMELLNKFKII